METTFLFEVLVTIAVGVSISIIILQTTNKRIVKPLFLINLRQVEKRKRNIENN